MKTLGTHTRPSSLALRGSALAAVSALAITLGACGGDDGDASSGAEPGETAGKIALLLPESKTTRYERVDRPEFEAAIAEACPDCEVLYSNAEQDAAKQQQQVEQALVNGAEVLVLDPVDAEAARAGVELANQQGVPVISYDRLLVDSDIAYYVSFPLVELGKIQAEWLVDDVDGDDGELVLIHGSPTDPSTDLMREGVEEALAGAPLEVGAEYKTPEWSPDNAQRQMEQAITKLGADNVAGVYSANDGMAGGAISAMTGAGIDPLPPVTGGDAEPAALQRILDGEQDMTVYLPIRPEAQIAGQLAVALLGDDELDLEQLVADAGVDAEVTETDNGFEQVPSVLMTPVVVTEENIEETVIADGFVTAEEICTPEYRQACEEAGLGQGS